jgi:hypothetical protein
MKGNDAYPALWPQARKRFLEDIRKIFEFRIDFDAKGLECSCGWVDFHAARPTHHRPPNDISQLSRRVDGFPGSLSHDCSRDSSCVSLLTILSEDVSDLGFGERIDDIGRGHSLAVIHSHIQRSFSHEAEAAFCLLKLKGGNAQVQ